MTSPAPRVDPASTETPRSFYEQREAIALLKQTRPFASARLSVALWQLLSTITALVLVLACASWLGPSLWLIPCALLAGGCLVRLFIIQHDMGHHSFFPTKRANDLGGLALSTITSVCYEAWRTEHAWHHNHQGRLSKRGVDQRTAPMIVEEIAENRAEAQLRADKTSARNVFLISAYALLIERRVPRGFFPFSEAFGDRLHNRAKMLWGIALTLPLHLLWHALIIWTLGWWVSALVVAPGMVVAAGVGGLLFWVQHNFEHTYYDEDEGWNKANVAIHGSSYLRLNPIFDWFTGSIGLHHVHHLNPRIPNYRLEAARQDIDALRDVPPITREGLSRSFTHIFWDTKAYRMRDASAVQDALKG